MDSNSNTPLPALKVITACDKFLAWVLADRKERDRVRIEKFRRNKSWYHKEETFEEAKIRMEKDMAAASWINYPSHAWWNQESIALKLKALAQAAESMVNVTADDFAVIHEFYIK